MEDANPENCKIEERARALRSLKNLSLDSPNKSIIWKDAQKKVTILRSVNEIEPESVRVEALGILKNMSLDVNVRVEMYQDEQFRDQILNSIRVEESSVIRKEGFRLMANLAIAEELRVQMYEDACWNLCDISPSALEETRRDAFKTLQYLTLATENKARLWEEFDMRKRLLQAAAPGQPQAVREPALGIIANLVLDPKLGKKLWKSIAGVRDLLIDAASATNKIALQENALRAIANLASFPENQEHMFMHEPALMQLSKSANVKRAACVRRWALCAFRHCTENDVVKKTVGDRWQQDTSRLKWLTNGARKIEPNSIRIEAIRAIANLAELESNQQPLWSTEWLRDVILTACQPVVLPGIPTKNTPEIEHEALRAMGLLTGVDMAEK